MLSSFDIRDEPQRGERDGEAGEHFTAIHERLEVTESRIPWWTSVLPYFFAAPFSVASTFNVTVSSDSFFTGRTMAK